MAASSTLLIRADAGPDIGAGHVMRCLALAQAWQDVGGQAVFMTGREAPALAERLKSENMKVVHLEALPGSAEDAAETASLAHQVRASWVVADGYHFKEDYQRQIKDAHLRLLVIDDYRHANDYTADIILNQNIYAEPEMYPARAAHTRIFAGTRYALLRREFARWCGWERPTPATAKRILVTLGGGEASDAARKVIKALQRLKTEGLEIVILASGDSACQKNLMSCLTPDESRIRILGAVTDMPAWLQWADMAVSAGGSTCWETAFLGLPSILLVLAENQRRVAEGLEEQGVSINLGRPDVLHEAELAAVMDSLIKDQDRRREMSRRGRQLVDGCGAGRVAEQMWEESR